MDERLGQRYAGVENDPGYNRGRVKQCRAWIGLRLIADGGQRKIPPLNE